MNFTQLGLIEPILKALHEQGYENPTPIQAQAIPHLLRGKDLLGCAQTGTGKTAAFALPILQHLHENASNQQFPRVLILTPTRELALQIDESFTSYGQYLGVKHCVIFGGVSQVPQVQALRKQPAIVVATPGRLLDLMNQGEISLVALESFVLDEADRMLDMGFIHDVRKIVSKLPVKRQTIFFSATMPQEIASLAQSLLNTSAVNVEVSPVSSTVDAIEQKIYFVEKPDKANLLLHVLKEVKAPQTLVFTRTKHGADKLVKFLKAKGVASAAIHGNKSQNARQKALSDFKSGQIPVLIATDIAARGIDIESLPFVINYEIPNVSETYVHRIGRTGRAGNSGRAISFCDQEERSHLRAIQKLIGKSIPVVDAHPFSSTVASQNAAQSAKAPAQSHNKAAGFHTKSRKNSFFRSRRPATV